MGGEEWRGEGREGRRDRREEEGDKQNYGTEEEKESVSKSVVESHLKCEVRTNHLLYFL